jgi:hypothetical protein
MDKITPLVDGDVITWGRRLISEMRGNEAMWDSTGPGENSLLQRMRRAIEHPIERDVTGILLEAAGRACCSDEIGGKNGG